MIRNDYERDIIYITRDFEEVSSSQSADIAFSSKQTRINDYIIK